MDILTSKRQGILRIQFNRPARKNAITSAMYTQLADALAQAAADTEVRAVLLSGSADAFTAGNDLEDFMKHFQPLTGAGDERPVFAFMRALAGFEKPVVAAVAGVAVGIGTTLLLHCDLVYAADNARFSLPFAQLGLCPEFASSLLLTQVAGYQRAAEKLLLGEAFDAAEAHAMGLVTRAVPAAELDALVEQKLALLAALPPASLRATKALMARSRTSAVNEAMAAENTRFAAMLQGEEAREAFTAFFEKRRPDYSRFQ